MKYSKIILIALFAAILFIFFTSGLHQELTLEAFKAKQADFIQLFNQHPVFVACFYFVLYLTIAALSLPGAALLTIVGGALFGFWLGLLLASFASTIGATLAFLMSRFLLREWVQNKFGTRLKSINQGMKQEGAFYLFALRLVPIFPFFIVNVIMGLMPIRTLTFYLVSQAGMLAGTAVYINFGKQIGQINSLSGLISFEILASFALLGLFPLIAKKILNAWYLKQLNQPFTKPKQFDRNLIVIGAGSAGLVTSYIAAAVKAKVTLVERHKMGGDCLNTGCVPSKAFIRSAKFIYSLRHAQAFGINTAHCSYDFSQIMDRVQRVIQTIEPHDSTERYTNLGVECKKGHARIISPWEVEIIQPDGQKETLTTKNIVIATGAKPFIPDIPGLNDVGYYTSDTIWQLREQPKRLLVMGGGPIGCELSQSFQRLGCQVILVQGADRLMPREDPEVSDFIAHRFQQEGIKLKLNSRVINFSIENGSKIAHIKSTTRPEIEAVEFDALLLAVGRQANLTGFGLEELGIECNKTIVTNAYLQTRFPNIYACGDVAGPYQFTHTAAHQAWYASVNSLFGRFKKFKVDYSVIPWTTFTDPEVAHVGLNEHMAKSQGIAHEITHYGLDDLDRAIADEAAEGWIKVLTVPGKDTILGCTIVGQHAGDLLAEFVLAMKHKLGLNKILGTIHSYPTWAEANKFAAGQWKKAHAPQRLLHWVEKFHQWQRGS